MVDQNLIKMNISKLNKHVLRKYKTINKDGS